MTEYSKDQRPDPGLAWPLILAVATVAGSLAAACMMPFVALAALAAATMTRGRAVAMIAAIWAANQVLGFTVLGYPATTYAAAWGAALGTAALAATFIARATLRGRSDLAAAPMLTAFGAAFTGYELLLFGFALIVGGTDMFMPSIIIQILFNDALWFAGLGALYHLLTRAAPGWFGPAPAPRLA